MSRAAVGLAVLLLAACASTGDGGGNDGGVDAKTAPPLDGSIADDAAPGTPDAMRASPDASMPCVTHEQCTTAGTCCFFGGSISETGQCVEGVVNAMDQCLPVV